MNKDDGKTHWKSCYLDHIECAYEKIIRLEDDNKYQKKMLEELQQDNEELRDKLYKNWEIITQLQNENKKLKAEVQHLMECLNEGRR